MSGTIANLAYMFKTLYSKERIYNIINDKFPFFSKIRKIPGFVGAGNFEHPIEDSYPQGASASLTKAIASISSSKGDRWLVPRKFYYGACKINGEAIRASKTDAGAFRSMFEREMDRTLKNLRRRWAYMAAGDGTAVLGQRTGALIAVNTIQLTSIDTARFFSRGMTIEAGPNADGTGLRVATGVVDKINRKLGQITLVSAAALVAAGFVTLDFIFPNGDSGGVIPVGLRGWVPPTDPTATLFMGVDRTKDNEVYGGNRIDATLSSPEEALIDAQAYIQDLGGVLRAGFTGPLAWADLAKRREAKVMKEQGGEGKVGLSYFELVTPDGSVPIFSDASFPNDTLMVGDTETCFMPYCDDEFINVINEDGNDWRKVAGEDAFQIEFHTMTAFINAAPGYWFNIKVA